MVDKLTYPKALALLSDQRRQATEARLAEWSTSTGVGRCVEENLKRNQWLRT